MQGLRCIGRLCSRLAGATVMRMYSWEGAVSLRGDGWRICWVGPSDVDCAALAAVIRESYQHVKEMVQRDFNVRAPAKPPLRMICGPLDRILAEFRRGFDAVAEGTAPVGVYLVGLATAIVGGDPADSHFARVATHELCHAVCDTWLGARHGQAWAVEGYAELAEHERLPEAARVLETLKSAQLELHRGPCRVEAVLSGDAPFRVSWGPPFGAELLVRFLQSQRAQHPGAWSVVRQAIGGRLRGSANTVAALECAFGCPLDAINKLLGTYCDELCAAVGIPQSHDRRRPDGMN